MGEKRVLTLDVDHACYDKKEENIRFD